MEVVCPGQRLGLVSELLSGSGTHVRGGRVFASLVGVKVLTESESEAAAGKMVVSVQVPGERPPVIPEVGHTVTCKIVSINPRFAKASIVCVEGLPLKDPFRAMIRVQDVRATEKDKVEISKSFRSGDVVLAKVISLGDARSYFLSTAENELGVVYATSAAGAPLTPISWCEMQCPKTGIKEPRKVAKVDVDVEEETDDAAMDAS